MGWLDRNLPKKFPDPPGKPKFPDPPGKKHNTHDWSGWQDSSAPWQEERFCACGAQEWRNKPRGR